MLGRAHTPPDTLPGRRAPPQESLEAAKGALVKEQQAVAGARRSREAFLAVWAAHRARSGAARTVQRHFRAWRVRRLLAQTSLDARVRAQGVEGLLASGTQGIRHARSRPSVCMCQSGCKFTCGEYPLQLHRTDGQCCVLRRRNTCLPRGSSRLRRVICSSTSHGASCHVKAAMVTSAGLPSQPDRLTACCLLPRQALQAAESQRSALEAQRAAALAAQRAHLAWSGQALVANSLVLMDEAADQIRAAFLLPQKELRRARPAPSQPQSYPNFAPGCNRHECCSTCKLRTGTSVHTIHMDRNATDCLEQICHTRCSLSGGGDTQG